MRRLRGFALLLLVSLFIVAPAAADASAYYQHRGLCGLAAVGIKLFGYAEVVEIGVGFGAPRSEVVGFIAWCGSRGVGGDDNPSAGPETRECTFSTDCPKSCSGTNILQESCVNYKCVPPASVETRCELQSTTIASYSFPNTCTGSGAATTCGKDTAAIRAKRAELEAQYNDLNGNQRPALNNLFLKANKICLNGLADVTNKLIVETANTFRDLPRKMIDVISDLTGKLIDEVTKKYNVVNQPTDTQQEFFLSMCNLEKQIKNTDMPLLDRKIQKLLDDIKALDAA